MAEQTFKSPGFFEREIDLAPRQQQPFGVPAAVIGTALKGPAFVPVTVGDFSDFVTKFGGLSHERFGPYAVNEFLRHKTALTYVRVLGAGANKSPADISRTERTGQVKSAGFVVTGSLLHTTATGEGRGGDVHFICGKHVSPANEAFGMPMFTDNNFSPTLPDTLVRGVLLLASDSRMLTRNESPSTSDIMTTFIHGHEGQAGYAAADGQFELYLSSSAGSAFNSDDIYGVAGVKRFTVSLNPSSASYIANVLNTDPNKFSSEKHLLYAHFPVDAEVSAHQIGSATDVTVGLASGSAGNSSVSGDESIAFRELFGHFDTRYTTPSTTKFISQPFGAAEYDLFKIESLDDGVFANTRYKISITDLRKSTDERSDFGTFSLQVRDFNDIDNSPSVLEQFDNLTLNPDDENYIAKKIGDKKAFFNHDATEDEQRIVVQGQFPNMSKFIRVVMEDVVKDKEIPDSALPFGFRGLELLKTNQLGNDTTATGQDRLAGVCAPVSSPNEVDGINFAFTGSILPPIPFRAKVTRGQQSTTPGQKGDHSKFEVVNESLYWGIKNERNNSVLDPNSTTEINDIVANMTKFMGIRKLDTLYTGSVADTFNNNKFSLSKVVLPNSTIDHLTASARVHMLDTVYWRNGTVNTRDYTINDGASAASNNRITFATLLANTSSLHFNKFSNFAKFTTVLHGGFDGTNILDPDAAKLNDKSASTDTGGGAATTATTSPGLAVNPAGTKLNNNTVSSLRTAIDLLSNEFVSNHNILAIPGHREALVTDHAADKTREYGKALSVMDLPQYDSNGTRLYDDRKVKPDVEKTIESLDNRGFDNNYTAAYFPDVEIDDLENTRRVKVPPSVPALASLAFNDKVAFPWFAPAGFNRAALGFVKNVDVRLSAPDRDDLYEARINPIATFPRTGFVIFGQKTMQQAKSALDRVNVRRLLNECKRIIGDIAQGLLFEPNTPATRQRFVSQSVLQLGVIQAQAGLENFKVIMDGSNNTQKDVEENRLNGTIVIVPTRTVEFIAIDFIVTSAGVEFV